MDSHPHLAEVALPFTRDPKWDIYSEILRSLRFATPTPLDVALTIATTDRSVSGASVAAAQAKFNALAPHGRGNVVDRVTLRVIGRDIRVDAILFVRRKKRGPLYVRVECRERAIADVMARSVGLVTQGLRPERPHLDFWVDPRRMKIVLILDTIVIVTTFVQQGGPIVRAAGKAIFAPRTDPLFLPHGTTAHGDEHFFFRRKNASCEEVTPEPVSAQNSLYRQCVGLFDIENLKKIAAHPTGRICVPADNECYKPYEVRGAFVDDVFGREHGTGEVRFKLPLRTPFQVLIQSTPGARGLVFDGEPEAESRAESDEWVFQGAAALATYANDIDVPARTPRNAAQKSTRPDVRGAITAASAARPTVSVRRTDPRLREHRAGPRLRRIRIQGHSAVSV